MKPWMRTLIDATAFYGYAATFRDMSPFGWACSLLIPAYVGWRYAELKAGAR